MANEAKVDVVRVAAADSREKPKVSEQNATSQRASGPSFAAAAARVINKCN
jgi:hypothetical protein